MSREWNMTTTRNRHGGLPKPGDKINVDGIPADVVTVDQFKGIEYQITIPGLIVDGKQQFFRDWAPWDIVLDLHPEDLPF